MMEENRLTVDAIVAAKEKMKEKAIKSIPTMEEVIRREKEAFEADPVGLIKAGYLKIRNKDAEEVPFVLNSTQKKIVEKIQERRRQGRPAFVFVLKARQLGISTLSQALGFAFTSQRRNRNSLIIADDVDGAEYIFKMNEMFYDKMKTDHPHLTPNKKRSDEQRLEFEGTYSKMMIDTAKNATAGRKFTLQFVHLSEVAFYRNFNQILQALWPAIAQAPDTVVIFETTANGLNEVSKFYWKIKAEYEKSPDTTDWIVMFCSWKEHQEYQRAFHSESYRKNFEESLNAKERKIMAAHGLTLEQMHWRRRMIEDAFGGDDERFEVEFPLTDKEAFKSTSRRVFPERLTEPQVPNIIAPKARGELVRSERSVGFMPDPQGFLKIYQTVIPEERYVIGADSCESALKFDEACAQVIRRSTWSQVAHLHGHMFPQDFADKLVALGLYYNTALLAPERNGPGLVTVTRLAEIGYPNICRQTKSVVSDQGVWSETEEYGFHTNVKTKPQIIDTLQNALRTLLVVLHDRQTLDQLETYVIRNIKFELDLQEKASIQMGADEGHHDDCVMSLAIALHYAKMLPESFGQSPIQERISNRITGY